MVLKNVQYIKINQLFGTKAKKKKMVTTGCEALFYWWAEVLRSKVREICHRQSWAWLNAKQNRENTWKETCDGKMISWFKNEDAWLIQWWGEKIQVLKARSQGAFNVKKCQPYLTTWNSAIWRCHTFFSELEVTKIIHGDLFWWI